MRLSVIGCGYLGAVHAAAMASIGHEVVGIDVDERKIAALSQGLAPFFEPGLQEILTEGIASGRLSFTTDMAAASGAKVHFVGVGTPQQKDGYAADLTYVNAAVDGLIPYLAPGDIVAGKSTVPVGTAATLAERTRISGIAAGTLADPPPIDKLVVCQGDPCAPNTLISRDGDFLAHVDLARLGVADRWADLAIMTLSLGWNYTNYDEQDFWDAYGVEPDAERIAYYRELWDAE